MSKIELMKNYNTMLRRKTADCEDDYGPPATNNLRDSVWSAQLQDREIVINSPIDEDIIERVVIQILNFNKLDAMQDEALFEATGKEIETYHLKKPIKIFINSIGGNIDEAFSVVSAIATSKTPVFTYGLGKCWSAGFLILLAGHQRFAQPYANLMYHQGSGGYAGEFGKHEAVIEEYKRIQLMVEDFVKSRTKIPKKKLKEVFEHKLDWFMTAKEALELGVIDGIF
jgi:ATP-dependent Clp protease protease subunit